MDSMHWHSSAKTYLARLGMAEWHAQGRPMGNRRNARRYSPSAYHRALIDCLDKNDENAFKVLKMLEGYASAVGV